MVHPPKYIFSTTLDNGEAWKNSTLIKGGLAQEIAKLKQLPGKNIGTVGSPTLVSSLLEQGLLDELILLVHPVVAGNGKRLFKDGGSLKRLKLLSSKTTRTGTVIITYQPRSGKLVAPPSMGSAAYPPIIPAPGTYVLGK